MRTLGWLVATTGAAALALLAGITALWVTLLAAAAVTPISAWWLLLVLPAGAALTFAAMRGGGKLYERAYRHL